MNIEDQTLCPNCHNIFTELNPPRLLTMCGHTFCSQCIASFTQKKKNHLQKHKLICPLDKIAFELINQAFLFPKNLILLNLAKRKVNSLSNSRVSDITKSDQKYQQDQETASSFYNQKQLMKCKSDLGLKQKDKKDVNNKSILHQTCLLHQKPIELVCVRDCHRICASCVIFGEHKGHTVKTIHQIQQMTQNLIKKFKQYYQKQQNCFKKLESKETKLNIQFLIKKRSQQLSKEIASKFKDIINFVMQEQKNAQQKLKKSIQQYTIKFNNKLQQQISLKQKYQDWQNNILQKISCLESQNEQEKIRILLKSNTFIQASQRKIHIISAVYNEFVNESEKMIESLYVNVDDKALKNCIKQFCQIQQCINSFLNITSSGLTENHFNEESLLDDIGNISTIPILSKESKKTENQQKKANKHNFSMTSPLALRCAGSRLNSTINNNTSRVKMSPSPNRKNSSLKSSRIKGINGSKASFYVSQKIKGLPEKFENKIDSIVRGSTDVLDLTNGQLGDGTVLAILQYLKDQQISILKLVRNKLTDQYLINSIPLMDNIVMLNISRNQLTEKSIQLILNKRKQGHLKSLKSMMVGQNKIIQRKHKELFEELKNLGVNVCI